jgi:hypothetical protein
MEIYMEYKKSDMSITGFVFEDNTHYEETDTHNISTNKIEWLEEKTVVYYNIQSFDDMTMIKTYEDVMDTINNTHQVSELGVVSLIEDGT